MTLTAIAILLLLILLVLLYMAGFFSWLAEKNDEFWGEDTGAWVTFWYGVIRWGFIAFVLFFVIPFVFEAAGDKPSDKFLALVALVGLWFLYQARKK